MKPTIEQVLTWIEERKATIFNEADEEDEKELDERDQVELQLLDELKDFIGE